jgi:hypothetical protein
MERGSHELDRLCSAGRLVGRDARPMGSINPSKAQVGSLRQMKERGQRDEHGVEASAKVGSHRFRSAARWKKIDFSQIQEKVSGHSHRARTPRFPLRPLPSVGFDGAEKALRLPPLRPGGSQGTAQTRFGRPVAVPRSSIPEEEGSQPAARRVRKRPSRPAVDGGIEADGRDPSSSQASENRFLSASIG